jgi:hypothetical protein
MSEWENRLDRPNNGTSGSGRGAATESFAVIWPGAPPFAPTDAQIRPRRVGRMPGCGNPRTLRLPFPSSLSPVRGQQAGPRVNQQADQPIAPHLGDAPLPRKGYPLPISFLPAPIRTIMHPGRGGSRILPRRITAIIPLGSPPRAWSGRSGRYEIGPYTELVGKG